MFLAILLSPAVIYVLGVSSRRATLRCGAPMLLLTCLSWGNLHRSPELELHAGALVLLVFPVTLLISIAGMIWDRRHPYS